MRSCFRHLYVCKRNHCLSLRKPRKNHQEIFLSNKKTISDKLNLKKNLQVLSFLLFGLWFHENHLPRCLDLNPLLGTKNVFNNAKFLCKQKLTLIFCILATMQIVSLECVFKNTVSKFSSKFEGLIEKL